MSRLYTVVIDAYPVDACDIYPSGDYPEHINPVAVVESGEIQDDIVGSLIHGWEPENWADHDMGDREFYWPATGFVYRSRSAATARAGLIESYGAKATVYECDPVWVSVAAANKHRRLQRVAARVAKLRRLADEIEAAA